MYDSVRLSNREFPKPRSINRLSWFWLKYIKMSGSIAQSVACLTADPGIASLNPSLAT